MVDGLDSCQVKTPLDTMAPIYFQPSSCRTVRLLEGLKDEVIGTGGESHSTTLPNPHLFTRRSAFRSQRGLGLRGACPPLVGVTQFLENYRETFLK